MGGFMLTLTQALSHTLDYVLLARSRGLCTEETWAAYAHAWQTGAPRFGAIRYCSCAECLAKYPPPEFRPPFTSELKGIEGP